MEKLWINLSSRFSNKHKEATANYFPFSSMERYVSILNVHFWLRFYAANVLIIYAQCTYTLFRSILSIFYWNLVLRQLTFLRIFLYSGAFCNFTFLLTNTKKTNYIIVHSYWNLILQKFVESMDKTNKMLNSLSAFLVVEFFVMQF